eukprot:1019-Heterococcus_DN1.PRE.2
MMKRSVVSCLSNGWPTALLLREGDDWMYLGAVAFTRSLKKGAPFAECCPMLNDISGQPSWKKISQGMIKLYEGEVLGKLPVVQHFLFGSLLPATWSTTQLPQPPTARTSSSSSNSNSTSTAAAALATAGISSDSASTEEHSNFKAKHYSTEPTGEPQVAAGNHYETVTYRIVVEITVTLVVAVSLHGCKWLA